MGSAQLRRTYFWESIGVCSKNCHIAGLRIGVVVGNILFHCQLQGLFLLISRGPRIFTNMLGFHDMFDDAKWRRHDY
jgi:hypothetical protein